MLRMAGILLMITMCITSCKRNDSKKRIEEKVIGNWYHNVSYRRDYKEIMKGEVDPKFKMAMMEWEKQIIKLTLKKDGDFEIVEMYKDKEGKDRNKLIEGQWKIQKDNLILVPKVTKGNSFNIFVRKSVKREEYEKEKIKGLKFKISKNKLEFQDFIFEGKIKNKKIMSSEIKKEMKENWVFMKG